MPIKMSKFVDIKSGINNIKTATEKELIARIFTKSASLTEDVVECETLEDVGEIFATSSDEYKIASKYFSFINKYARSPRKISFAKDYSDGVYASVTSPQMTTADDLERVKGFFSAKDINVELNGVGTDISVSISSSVYTDIYTLLNNIKTAINTALTTAEVPVTCTATDVSSGVATIKFQANEKANGSLVISGEGADILKLNVGSEPTIVNGVEDGYTNAFDLIYQENNNFATFVFLSLTDSTNASLLADHVRNVYPSEFMMIMPVTSATYSSVVGATQNIDGISLELCGHNEDEGKFNFVLPMAITATTDYNKENGTVNYMYTQHPEMVTVVDDDNNASIYDNAKINYYGRTQQAGQKIAFYQNGVLQGNYQDQNIFVNEIWLKDALSTKFLNYMLLTPNWYANKSGQAIGQGLVTDVIERAKLNGTITTEKNITDSDKVYIYNVTNDENAWRQIYEQGYYLITSIEKVSREGQEVYQFKYTLLYSKGDSIKRVEGLNILI